MSKKKKSVSIEEIGEDIEERNEVWVGEGVIKDGVKYYDSLKINTTLYKVGDCVNIAAHNRDTDYVCKILSLYENLTTNEKQVSIQWFYYSDEIPKRMKDKIPPLKGNEIIYTDQVNVLLSDCIMGKIHVAPTPGPLSKVYCRWKVHLKSAHQSSSFIVPYTGDSNSKPVGRCGDRLLSNAVAPPTSTTRHSLSSSNKLAGQLNSSQAVSNKNAVQSVSNTSSRNKSQKEPKNDLKSNRQKRLKLDNIHGELFDEQSGVEYSDSDGDGEGEGEEEELTESSNCEHLLNRKRRRSVRLSVQAKDVIKNTPTKGVVSPLSSRKIITPKKKSSVYQQAQEQLHVAAVKKLLCRENEFDEIFKFIKTKMRHKLSGCMYIAGVPGTGKTATMYQVTRHLNEARNLPSFKFIELNGLKVSEPKQAYVEILKQLTGQVASPSKAADILDNYFSSAKPSHKNKSQMVVMLADEIDILYTRKQSILYHLFDWPSRSDSRLIVLAIANTMDLPERVMVNRVISRIGLTRLTFQPYNFHQLETIISSRMKGLKVFQPEAITFASRRVAAVTGDARKALDLSRRAIELAREKKKKLVGMVDVNDAIQEMFSSPLILAVKNSSLNQKLLIRAILANFQSTGTDVTTLNEVYGTLLRIQGGLHMSSSEVANIAYHLDSIRVILLEKSKKGVHRKIRLNMNQTDIEFALKDDYN